MIGAGTGVFSAPIGERVGPERLVIAVEVNPGFLPIILDNARRAGVSNVRAVLGEFEDPKIPRNDIDVAFFHDVLHHVQERAAYVQALVPYMGQESRIFVVDYDRNVEGVPHSDQPEMLIFPRRWPGGWPKPDSMSPASAISSTTGSWSSTRSATEIRFPVARRQRPGLPVGRPLQTPFAAPLTLSSRNAPFGYTSGPGLNAP
ncbi:MAG: class I SAM-dependent methyltransferase [Gammaproteobacteria bacterium]|nr:class I SAM-dependent methyltransferase [Gammaproteobacteria bacterium]MDE0248472.1 class I SAM-dependent methyltransferase [Gammaproteobacteria bacterium]